MFCLRIPHDHLCKKKRCARCAILIYYKLAPCYGGIAISEVIYIYIYISMPSGMHLTNKVSPSGFGFEVSLHINAAQSSIRGIKVIIRVPHNADNRHSISVR